MVLSALRVYASLSVEVVVRVVGARLLAVGFKVVDIILVGALSSLQVDILETVALAILIALLLLSTVNTAKERRDPREFSAVI